MALAASWLRRLRIASFEANMCRSFVIGNYNNFILSGAHYYVVVFSSFFSLFKLAIVEADKDRGCGDVFVVLNLSIRTSTLNSVMSFVIANTEYSLFRYDSTNRN